MSDLEGAITVGDWWPDGSALLLVNTFEGRGYLYRYEIASGELTLVPDRARVTSGKARVRPDGGVWLVHEQGHRQRLVLDDAGAEVLTLGALAPPRRARTSPGTSRTSTASASTASTSRRTTRAARSR